MRGKTISYRLLTPDSVIELKGILQRQRTQTAFDKLILDFKRVVEKAQINLVVSIIRYLWWILNYNIRSRCNFLESDNNYNCRHLLSQHASSHVFGEWKLGLRMEAGIQIRSRGSGFRVMTWECWPREESRRKRGERPRGERGEEQG